MGTCVVLTIFALVIPSFFARLILAGLGLAVAVAWAITASRRTSDVRNPALDQTQAPDVHSLFNATMAGMREGLLVVDKDMRVVASNPAARKLFSPTLPALESQRLTELTRNPAIYSAFLDGLKGSERSG